MMHPEMWVRLPLVKAAGWALFHSLWEGAMVAAVLAGILTVTRSARSRYAAACLGMAALLLAFGVTFVHLVPQQRIPGAIKNPITLDWNIRAGDGSIAGLRARREIADLLPWLGPFWMAGVVLFYLKHLAGWLGARHFRRTGVCAAAAFWQERLDRISARMRISRPVTLLESCLAEVPVVIGHVRPVILLPVGLVTGLPAGQIELILLHELAHIRRYDYLVNMLQTSAEGLLFYHPVAWWISRIIRTEREHCCDDLAVAVSGDAHEYAAALAALEQNRWAAPEIALAATGGSLVKRIRRLLLHAEGPSSALTPFFSAGILMITAAAGLTAWQATTPAPVAPAPEVRFRVTGIVQAEPAQTLELAQAQAISPYTKWLNEDVAYIITPEERAAFLRLETDDERQQFIEQFWLRRDPTPGTPENEFKDEHYRRIAYANLHYPTATGTPGWKTDRGRIYITFGWPDEITTHPNGDATTKVPYERWLYRFIEGIGNDVSMDFVDPTGSNEFQMTRDPAVVQ
jgi:GWxTD domain-containing protein